MDNNVERAAKSQTADSTAPTTAAAAVASAGAVSAASGNVLANANSTFWKNSGRRVPGRPSPKRELDKSVGGAGVGGVAVGRGAGPNTGMVSTFRDYQQSVSDAWDTGDDEFCIISSTEAAAAAAAGAGGGNIFLANQAIVSRFYQFPDPCTDARISRQMSQTVALNVIETHSRSNQNHNASRSASDCGADLVPASRNLADDTKEDRRSLPDSNENR